MALAEGGAFRRPVVHLHVYVGVYVGIPVRAVAPDALEIARQLVAPARRAHKRVASVVEDKGLDQAPLRLGKRALAAGFHELVERNIVFGHVVEL